MSLGRTFSFGETDPKKIDEIIKPKFEDNEIDDDQDVDVDTEDIDDDEPTESYSTTVNLTPHATRTQFPFGSSSTGTTSVYQPGITPPNPVPPQAQRTFGTTPTFGGGTSGYQSNPLYRPANPTPSPFTSNSLSGGSLWNSSTPSSRFNPGGWGNYGTTNSGYGTNYNLNPGYMTNGERRPLPRHCRVLFCELDDVLIQPIVSDICPTGRVGIGRRGIYDVQLKWPVWEVIRCINPEFVFIITNQDINPNDQEALTHYQEMTDSIVSQLSKFIYISQDRCKCFTKLGRNRNEFTKPNTGLMTRALQSVPGLANVIRREDMAMIGAQSGGPGQSDVDFRMAMNFGINEYIPVDQILLYY